MWTNLETLNQQPHSIIEEVGQQSQIQLNSLDDSGQQTQKIWKNLDSLNQHPQNGIEEMGQQSQSKRDNLEDLGQQTQDTWKNLETLNQKPQSEIENLGQETQNTWNNLEKNLTPQLESELNQQNLNNWNRIEEQQSRNQEEQMQPEFNVWDKINNFESQHNMESHNGNTNHQQFYSSHKKNVDTWDQTFQHYNLSQRTNESKPTTSNTEKNLWDIINKAISEYDKETDNINHKQYISNQEWEEKYSAHNNYYHNSHYFHQQHNFGETKETLTEKTITQSKETNKYLGFEVIDHSITSSTTEKVKSTEKPKIIIPIPENNSPVEIGRGDIGADEIPPLILEVNDKSNSKKVEDDNTLNSDKLYKTQDEIESLSLTHFNGNQYNDKLNQGAADLSVMGLEQHVESINTPTRKPKDNHYNNQNNFLSDQTLPKQYRVPSYNKPLTVERNPTYEDLQKSEVQIPDNFEQQNFNPIWVDLEQQMSNKQDIIDLGQQKQEPININIQQEHYLHQQQNFDKNLQNKQEKIQRQDFHDYYNKHSLNEEQFHDVNNLKSVPKNDEIVEQPIESSEEPGFWKSVWEKTVSAKDKVVSWFKN
ncbi:unnamed protein product [Euphydryas editha]|nr:unnamed protein product [Euphydryas editha]